MKIQWIFILLLRYVCKLIYLSIDMLICVGVFRPPTSKFVFARLAQMVCLEDTRVYTGSDGTSLRPVRCCSCYRYLVCSMGYKQARERISSL